MSRSPVTEASSPAPGMARTYVPGGTLMVSAPGRAFVSWTAARSVHAPASVDHAPSPGLASTASAVLSTVKLAAMAPLARPIKATEAMGSKSKRGLGIGCPPGARGRWVAGDRGARSPRPRALVSRPGVEIPQGFVQGSWPDPGGSSPNLPILKPGPCVVSPVRLDAALGQGYAMSCVVGNTHRPFVST